MKTAIRVARVPEEDFEAAGELLREIEPANGANQNISGDAPTKVLTRQAAAAEEAELGGDEPTQLSR
jgi:hypothetical protein